MAPWAPQPLNLGLLLGSNNAAAMDWVGAILLAYDPVKISLVRHVFDQFRCADCRFSGEHAVSVLAGDLGVGSPSGILETFLQPVENILSGSATRLLICRQGRPDFTRLDFGRR